MAGASPRTNNGKPTSGGGGGVASAALGGGLSMSDCAEMIQRSLRGAMSFNSWVYSRKSLILVKF